MELYGEEEGRQERIIPLEEACLAKFLHMFQWTLCLIEQKEYLKVADENMRMGIRN